MAAATILLRRSVASSVSVGGSQLYCRYAVGRNDITSYIPTLSCFLRQFSSSSSSANKNMKSNDESPPYVIKCNSFVESPVEQQQPIITEAFVRDLLIKFNSTEKEKEALQANVRDLSTKFQSIEEELRKYKESEEQKANEEMYEDEDEDEDDKEEKDPSLKAIELMISNARESDSEAKQLPDGFKIECDEPGECMVKLEKHQNKETITITIELSPQHLDEYDMSFHVEVTSSRIFQLSKVEFHCYGGCPYHDFSIDKMKFPYFFTGVEEVFFGQLPKNVQEEIYNYLDTLGVNNDAARTLHAYMLHKMKRENLRILEKNMKHD